MVQVRQPVVSGDLESAVSTAVERSQAYFLRTQHPEGYWWGELESNPTMEAEFILLHRFLGTDDPEQERRLANHIRRVQRDDGSWGQYYGAPGDLSTSIECYFALKLVGVSPQAPRMVRAREFILSRGGVPGARVMTKIWLALFGQWDWDGVPAMPPELMLLPASSPVNIYEFSSWSRATIVPIMVIIAHRPVCPLPEWAHIDELYPVARDRVDYRPPRPPRVVSWQGLFWVADQLLRPYERLPWKPRRSLALRRAEAWILSHQEADGSWGGIQPPWVYSLIALKLLGHDPRSGAIAKGLRGFDGFMIEDGDTLRVQACVSPGWDTCLAMIAMQDSDLPPDHSALQQAARWLLRQQIRTGGDWQVKNPDTPPGGWAFEFANDTYPDIDDVAEVLIALRRVVLPEQDRLQEAIDRGTDWMLSMQSRNGGWAAFDKDNTCTQLSRLPFCDFGETLDPPSADVTAHVLEALARLDYPVDSQAIQDALAYLRKEQEEDGPWFGRWGVNYVYGTGAVLPALEALGADMTAPEVQRAVRWLADHQNPDGGWGESCASYADPSLRGKGPSTASQTAWALMALMAAGQWRSPALERGLEYLARTQREDGTWDEPWFTGTGFPGYGIGERLTDTPAPGERGHQGADLPAGFMINYHLYRNYWPLMALGRYRRYVTRGQDRSTAN